MNVFQRLGKSVQSLFSKRERQMQEHRHPERVNKFPNPMHGHMIKIRGSNGVPVFGPAFIPERDWSHVSRQACRHRLRALAFHQVSVQQPLLSRRDRRRWARAAAGIEYYNMMRDNTNTGEAAA